jgi:hypothetical protein
LLLKKGGLRVAVSKRLRYEVFRRDNFTCRYCGGKAPDVKLNVDAVVPEALGGSHKDVAACEACNGGKTSSSPDAPLVADVAERALEGSMERAGKPVTVLSSRPIGMNEAEMAVPF